MLRSSRLLPVVIGLIAAAQSADATPQAIFRPLTPPPGMLGSWVNAISADGSTVVGASQASDFSTKAFRWHPSAGATEPHYITPCEPGCEAIGVSANGSVVVGSSGVFAGGYTPTMWTLGGGAQLLPIPQPRHNDRAELVSDDGSLMIITSGSISIDLPVNGYSWTEAEGYQPISSPNSGITPEDISPIGNVVVGQTGFPFGPTDAFRWTSAGGVELLSTSADAFRASHAYATNADGSLVVGSYSPLVGNPTAFRWTAESGMVPFDNLGGDGEMVSPSAMSVDGSMIVGRARFDGLLTAAIWDPVHGTRRLADVLASHGVDLAGWRLFDPVDISADGTKIVGRGFGPNGGVGAWYVELVVPEPPLAALLAGLQLFATGRGRRFMARSEGFVMGSRCAANPSLMTVGD